MRRFAPLPLALAAACSGGPHVDAGGASVKDADGAAILAPITAAYLSPGCTAGYDTTIGQLRMVAARGCNQKFILALHGGAWAFGAATDMDIFAAQMTAAGIIYASLDYTNGAPMATILSQVGQAFSVIRANAGQMGVNPAQMGVMGFSAGGQLALQGGIDDGHLRWIGSLSGPPDLAALEANLCGQTDANGKDLCEKTRHALGGTAAAAPGEYKKYSPAKNAARFANGGPAPSVFLGHGDADELVPVATADAFSAQLTAMGMKAVYVRAPGGTHTSAYAALAQQAIANAAIELAAPPNAAAHADPSAAVVADDATQTAPATPVDGAATAPAAPGDAAPDITAPAVQRATLHRCYFAATQNHSYTLTPADCANAGAAYDKVAFDVVGPGPGTVAINGYTDGRFNYVLTAAAGALSGMTYVGPLGHLFTAPVAGSVPIYVCIRAADNNQVPTKAQNCEGNPQFTVQGTLGYGF